jgi:hypothetical protein
MRFGERDHLTHARRDQDAFPQAVLAGPKAATYLGVDFADVNAVCVERTENTAVALLEQRHEQMLGADVIVAVITALLFRYTKNAPRSGIEPGKQGLGTVVRKESAGLLGGGKFRDDWIRTSDLFVPNEALYQAEPHPEKNSRLFAG